MTLLAILKKSPILVLFATAFTTNAAYASFISYSDRATFLAETGATSATGGAISSAPGSVVLAPSYTQDRTKFSSVTNRITVGCPTGNPLLDYCNDNTSGWSDLLAGDDIALTGIENLDVSFDAPSVYGFGFEMIEPTVVNIGPGDAFIDSTFTVALLSGLTTLQSFTLNPVNDAVQFFGVWTDFQFDNIQIRETIGARENEFFGEFWAIDSEYIPEGTIPVPATLALFGLGLAGLAWSRRKKA